MSLSRGLFFASALATALLAAAGFVQAQEAASRPGAGGALAQLAGDEGCIGNAGDGCAAGRALDNAFHVAVSPDDGSVYVTSPGLAAQAVAVFARDRKTGVLAQLYGPAGCVAAEGQAGCAAGRALQGVHDVAVSPDGASVYVTTTFVASAGSGGVAVFARQGSDGALTQLADEAGCVDSNGEDGCARGRAVEAARGVAVSPDGRNVYVASLGDPWALAAFARDSATGALTQLDDEDGCVADGGGEDCAEGRALEAPQDVAVSPDGRNVYVAVYRGVAVFDRDRSTGALRQLRGRDGCVRTEERRPDDRDEGEDYEGDERGRRCARGRALGEGVSVAVSPDGRNVYVAAEALAVFDRDRRTGALTQLDGKDGCINSNGNQGCADARAFPLAGDVTVSPDGRTVYVTTLQGVTVFDRHRRTGALRQLRGEDGCVDQGGGRRCAQGRALDFASGVAVSPDGRSAYVASGVSDAVAVFARR